MGHAYNLSTGENSGRRTPICSEIKQPKLQSEAVLAGLNVNLT